MSVLAHDELREQADALAHGGQVVERAHGHIHLVAHAVAVQQHLGGFFSSRVPVNLPIIEVLWRRRMPMRVAPSFCRRHWLFLPTGIISVILRHTFPHNNTRLTHLCGLADAHLRTIEVALGVGIAHRHEQFKVDGPKAKATQAMELLQALYEMAERPSRKTTCS